MLEQKKKQFWNPWKISYKMYKIFFSIFFYDFYWKRKKNEPPPLAPHFGGF